MHSSAPQKVEPPSHQQGLDEEGNHATWPQQQQVPASQECQLAVPPSQGENPRWGAGGRRSPIFLAAPDWNGISVSPSWVGEGWCRSWFKYHRLSLFLMSLSRFSRINVSSFAIFPKAIYRDFNWLNQPVSLGTESRELLTLSCQNWNLALF